MRCVGVHLFTRLVQADAMLTERDASEIRLFVAAVCAL